MRYAPSQARKILILYGKVANRGTREKPTIMNISKK